MACYLTRPGGLARNQATPLSRYRNAVLFDCHHHHHDTSRELCRQLLKSVTQKDRGRLTLWPELDRHLFLDMFGAYITYKFSTKPGVYQGLDEATTAHSAIFQAERRRSESKDV